jgi:ABC-type lipoprotein export system ATPase subunit
MLILDKVSKYYQSDDNVTQALKDISLTLKMGEFVAITGESGSGKTTLLNVVSGLDSYEDGSMRIADDETSAYDQSDWEEYRKRYISFVFQNYNLIDAFTVYENVEIALTLNHPNLKDKKSRVLELIEKVGLKDHAYQKASKLSGGQKQRVSIARALAKDAPILVADEPTGNLDQATAKSIVTLMRELSKDKLVIFVTHEFDLVKDVATRRIRLFDGEVVEDKTLDAFEEKPYEEKAMEGLSIYEKLKLALKNLKSTPRKTFFTLLISVFIVAVFASSYGSYVQQSNVSNASFHPLFENLHESRLVITKQDGSAFTQTELSAFENEPGVNAAVAFDPVLDMYGLIENRSSGFNQGFNNANQFILGSDSRLTEGRLPEDAREIVLFNDYGYQVGDIVTVNLSEFQYQNMAPGSTDEKAIDMVVVGLHSEPNNFIYYAYVHPSFLSSEAVVNRAYFSVVNWGLTLDDEPWSQIYETALRSDLAASEIILSSEYFSLQGFTDLAQDDLIGETITLNLDNAYFEAPKSITVTIQDFETSADRFVPALQISDDLIARESQAEAYQIALMMDGSFSANQLRENLDAEFIGIYPAGYQDPFNQIFSVIGNIFQGFTSVILLLIMYFVSFLVLKNVIRSQEKSTLILRSIGAYKKDLYQTLIVELMVVMMIAFALVVGLLWVNQLGLNWVPNYLQYFA